MPKPGCWEEFLSDWSWTPFSLLGRARRRGYFVHLGQFGVGDLVTMVVLILKQALSQQVEKAVAVSGVALGLSKFHAPWAQMCLIAWYQVRFARGCFGDIQNDSWGLVQGKGGAHGTTHLHNRISYASPVLHQNMLFGLVPGAFIEMFLLLGEGAPLGHASETLCRYFRESARNIQGK